MNISVSATLIWLKTFSFQIYLGVYAFLVLFLVGNHINKIEFDWKYLELVILIVLGIRIGVWNPT